jgi:hypothetical protein
MGDQEGRVSEERYQARVEMVGKLTKAFLEAGLASRPALKKLDPEELDLALVVVSAHLWSAAVGAQASPDVTEEDFIELARQWWRTGRQADAAPPTGPARGGG